MAKKPKSPQFVACKIVITSHPKAPWRVSFPVEENGVTRRKRRMFSTEEKALAFAIGHEKEVADHGVRFGSVTAEARALDLSVINFDSDGFRTPAFHPTGEPTKTGARVAPLTAACKAWLGSQTRRTGLAWDDTPEEYQIEMRAVLEAAGVKGIYDGARHSFISYRTAEIRDVARAADECGNSPNVIKKHYREIVTGEAAKKFFSIRPVKRGKSKITNIESRRASA
jgi:hypothetical protein